jgi:hypothetical protein
MVNKLYTEAYNAYNGGLRACPGDATLSEKVEQAMRAIRTASSTSTDHSPRASNNASSQSSVYSTIMQYLKATSVVVAFGYLFPFSRSISSACYKYFTNCYCIDSYDPYGTIFLFVQSW